MFAGDVLSDAALRWNSDQRRTCSNGSYTWRRLQSDYDFLDPKIGEFYEALTKVVSLTGWIHGLKAVTSQLSWAWHEVATIERLFPALPGMAEYQEKLRRITKKSNEFLLRVVEDLVVCVFKR